MITADRYREQLQALLPQGAAWSREPGGVLTAVLDAWAQELGRFDQRCGDLIDEADPRTTNELLADWERVAGLPDPCLGASPSLGQRRATLVQRLITLGGATPAYFIAVALALGVAITITEYRPFDVNGPVNVPIYGPDWGYAWQVNAPLYGATGFLAVTGSVADALGWYDANLQLECVIRALKPAHTIVIFSYT